MAQGLKTGYVYHTPDIYNRTVQQPKSDARSPATMTSYRYEMLHGDNQTTPSRRARSQGKGNTYKNRAKWLNSPVKGTEYRKEFIQDSHTEPAILKDSKPEKETVVKILEVNFDVSATSRATWTTVQYVPPLLVVEKL